MALMGLSSVSYAVLYYFVFFTRASWTFQEPSYEAVQRNSFKIFNAIHAAMRQWGSSIEHNGMSFFPATIPKGVNLYHGTHKAGVIRGMEWLAFEIEHAEMFADMDRIGSRNYQLSRTEQSDGQPSQFVMTGGPQNANTKGHDPGYLHIYRTTRPQRLLYIDGMAAAKTEMGTLDTQDLLLRNRSVGLGWDEHRRAFELCKLAREWQIDGIVRMEAGFEIIKCDFSDGMELISANQRPKTPVYDSSLRELEYLRAVSQRYWDITASRVTLDYSRMLSAFFYPINLSNPIPAFADQPRLVYPSWQELNSVKSDLRDILSNQSHTSSVDWQGITDMIVTRYSDRLQFMAERSSLAELSLEVQDLLDIYIDYSTPDPNMAVAANKCTTHFLGPAPSATSIWPEHLIYVALQTVTSHICQSLFAVRRVVTAEISKEVGTSVDKARDIVRNLMGVLKWPEWKDCGRCGSDRICFVAMWPDGNTEDHYSPRCLNKTEIDGREGYWQ
ncbi:unnamed protein product [Clonostachys byssicola]|uniref:Uncharacterized protein n=1 Tax=Clonostachys byssicola TaxID=160290 RepID=A0A9N9XZH1_9HYPO|nr:unnamed protein product [Clonostachys byssicola]